MNFMTPTTELAQRAYDDAPVAEIFGIAAPDEVTVRVFQPTKLVPRQNDGYVFRKDQLKRLMAFFESSSVFGGLFVHGPFGSGKTSVIREYCARTRRPMFSVDWNFESEVEDLIGGRDIQFGDTTFTPGPLTVAMREGYTLLINEIDRGRPSNLTGLHGILDGDPLVIEATNEVIEPHPDFRLVVTANSAGSGDLTGTYTGSVRKQDPAFLDRFLFTECDYLDEVTEIEVLSREFPNFETQLLSAIVTFAGVTRGAALDTTSQLTIPLSTRTLSRTLWLASSYGLDQITFNDMSFDRLRKAFDATYFERLDPTDREVSHQMLKSVLPAQA